MPRTADPNWWDVARLLLSEWARALLRWAALTIAQRLATT